MITQASNRKRELYCSHTGNMDLSDEMTRDMRRKVRQKLKDDLNKVLGLSSKLEARELQLRQQSRLTTAHPSISDAQFSGNDLSSRYASGKEVTSQFDLNLNGFGHRDTSLASPIGVETLNKRRTSKANEVNNKPKAIAAKDDLPLSRRSNTFPNSWNSQDAGKLQGNSAQDPSISLNKYMPQCKAILKKLMGHEDGWIFNEPVDAVKLSLSDYHSVIKKPMDLGTVKTRLDKKQYKSLTEFADDIRLTFNNAMTYNPQGNDVHQSAAVLLSIFKKEWDVLKEKWEKNSGGKVNGIDGSAKLLDATLPNSRVDDASKKNVLGSKNFTQEKSKGSVGKADIIPGKAKATSAKSKAPIKAQGLTKTKSIVKPEAPGKSKVMAKSGGQAKSKASDKPKTAASDGTQGKAKVLSETIKGSEKMKMPEKPKISTTDAQANPPRKPMTYEEKVELQTTLGQLPQQMLEELIILMKERNMNMSQEDDEIEIDLDSFDDETLWELDRRAKASLNNIHIEHESPKQPIEDDRLDQANKKQKVLDSASLGMDKERSAMSGNKSSSESSSGSDSGSSSSTDSDR